MTVPYLIYCTSEGEIREEPRLQALAFGNQPVEAGDLIPLPGGVTLAMMPDRLAVGQKRSGEQQIITKSRRWAATAHLLDFVIICCSPLRFCPTAKRSGIIASVTPPGKGIRSPASTG